MNAIQDYLSCFSAFVVYVFNCLVNTWHLPIVIHPSLLASLEPSSTASLPLHSPHVLSQSPHTNFVVASFYDSTLSSPAPFFRTLSHYASTATPTHVQRRTVCFTFLLRPNGLPDVFNILLQTNDSPGVPLQTIDTLGVPPLSIDIINISPLSMGILGVPQQTIY